MDEARSGRSTPQQRLLARVLLVAAITAVEAIFTSGGDQRAHWEAVGRVGELIILVGGLVSLATVAFGSVVFALLASASPLAFVVLADLAAILGRDRHEMIAILVVLPWLYGRVLYLGALDMLTDNGDSWSDDAVSRWHPWKRWILDRAQRLLQKPTVTRAVTSAGKGLQRHWWSPLLGPLVPFAGMTALGLWFFAALVHANAAPKASVSESSQVFFIVVGATILLLTPVVVFFALRAKLLDRQDSRAVEAAGA